MKQQEGMRQEVFPDNGGGPAAAPEVVRALEAYHQAVAEAALAHLRRFQPAGPADELARALVARVDQLAAQLEQLHQQLQLHRRGLKVLAWMQAGIIGLLILIGLLPLLGDGSLIPNLLPQAPSRWHGSCLLSPAVPEAAVAPKLDGVGLLSGLRGLDPYLPVIVITAYASVESAVSVMRLGAYDYIVKPFKVDELKLVVAKALEAERLMGMPTITSGGETEAWVVYEVTVGERRRRFRDRVM